MLSTVSTALPAVGPAIFVLSRAICTSVAALEGAPKYTYTPPGSSIQDPAYAHSGHGSEAATNSLPDSKIMRPSKKAQWLKVTTRKSNSPLEPQSQSGAMLPPGCSLSDPHYSIRDPVYFVDTA
ncbi:hypothetical protein COO60DRAFT_1521024, partial [Scenedesmus sp. NREL 46B-D3]